MERNIWSLEGWVDCWKGIFDFWSLERNITSSPPRYHRPVGSLASSRQTIGNSWKGLWCRPPKIKMKVQRFFWVGAFTSRQVASWTSSKSTSAQGSAPLPAITTTQPNLPPSYRNPERSHIRWFAAKYLKPQCGVKWPTFENFYRPWIGWKGGDWTWVCGTTQFHRITSDSLDLFGISSPFKHFHCICKKHKYFWKDKDDFCIFFFVQVTQNLAITVKMRHWGIEMELATYLWAFQLVSQKALGVYMWTCCKPVREKVYRICQRI